jgi:pyruvate carboxylase subunit B
VKYTVTVGKRTIPVEVQGDSVQVDGRPVRAALVGIPQTPLRQLVLNGRARTFAMARAVDGWTIQASGRGWTVEVLDERTQALRELTGRGAGHAAGGLIRAPMPGLVVRVEVEVGQQLEAGAGVVVLEAMKMENEITTPGPGTVQAVHVEPGAAVEKGAPLVEVGQIEP